MTTDNDTAVTTDEPQDEIPQNVRTEEDVKREITETLQATVPTGESTIKDFFVQYVAHVTQAEPETVTVETCLSVLSAEFPELMMPLAEGNFMYGYQKGVDDVLASVFAGQQPPGEAQDEPASE